MKDGSEAMSDSRPPIPYGLGHFPTVRRDGFYYVDKTRFVRELEKVRFAFFVRPRRFGKTLWLTMLDAYYNRVKAGKFEAVFAGTDIGANPTANRSRYMVLYFDFSTHSERELGGGYADIWLEPNAAAHPDAPNGYLLEIKWLKPSASDAQVDVLACEATAQLRRYLADEPLRQRRPHIRYRGLALVYHGWKLAHAEAVEGD